MNGNYSVARSNNDRHILLAYRLSVINVDGDSIEKKLREVALSMKRIEKVDCPEDLSLKNLSDQTGSYGFKRSAGDK